MSRNRSRQHEIRVGALVLIAGFVFSWLAIRIGGMDALGDTITVAVRLPDAAGLVVDSGVKVAGVQVGRVRDLRVDFDHAVATLELSAEAGLRRDVRLSVRARSLLGEKYVALEPQGQTAPPLADGDTIADVLPPVEIDGLVQAFGPLVQQVRPEDVQVLVSGMARIAGAGADELPSLIADLKVVLAGAKDAAALGPELRQDVPRLLTDLRSATAELRAVLGQAGGTLDAARPAVDDAGAALARIGPLLDRVEKDLALVEPGLDDAGRALEGSDELVGRLQRIADDLDWLDRQGLRSLLREEGILVRLKPPKDEATP